MKSSLSIAVILMAGCGGASASAVVAPSSSSSSSSSSGGACPEAYFAVGELEPPACATGDGCVKIYQVTSDCTVVRRNVIEGATGTVAWPNVRGDLVLYEAFVGRPTARKYKDYIVRQMVVPSPLTTREVKPDAWKDITFGESDPEGAIDWDYVTDGRHAYAIGCGDWDQGEEEWTCSEIQFVRHDGARLDDTPIPAFARALAPGPVADGVTFARDGDSFVCKAGGATVDLTPIAGQNVAVSPWFGDQYFLWVLDPGTRTSVVSGFMPNPMKGCQELPTTRGWYIPGPGGLAGRVTLVGDEGEATVRIHLKGAAEPLTTADGKPFEVTSEIYWAAP